MRRLKLRVVHTEGCTYFTPSPALVTANELMLVHSQKKDHGEQHKYHMTAEGVTCFFASTIDVFDSECPSYTYRVPHPPFPYPHS